MLERPVNQSVVVVVVVVVRLPVVQTAAFTGRGKQSGKQHETVEGTSRGQRSGIMQNSLWRLRQ